MRVVTNLPYKVVPIELQPRVTGEGFTLIVKGTFALSHGEPLASLPADQQRDLSGDVPFMDDIGRSLSAASDLVPFKVSGEVTVTANACAPAGQMVTQLDVGIAVGKVSKGLRVFGDRAWVPSAIGPMHLQGPLPFETIPLRWERAFGGLSSRRNPMGRGMDVWPEADGRNIYYLANIETVSAPVVSELDRPDPVGFAPIPQLWEPRRARAGTQDVRWATFRAPLPPLDFDPRSFNAAPEDQWIEGYWRGDESITLYNLDPDVPTLVSALPGRRIRAFVHRRRADETGKLTENEEFTEVPMVCDTVHIDTVEKVAVLTWRGFYRPLVPKGIAIVAFYVAEEPLAGEPAGLQAHFDAYMLAAEPPPAAAPPPPKPPEPPPEQSPEEAAASAADAAEMTAALKDARKALADAKLNPEMLAAFDAATTPQAKLDATFAIMRSMISDMEEVIAKRPPT